MFNYMIQWNFDISDKFETIVLIINLIITSAISLYTFFSVNKDKKRSFLDQQLFELQKLSFYDAFVEDENYTKTWNDLKEKYQNNKLEGDNKRDFLKYDVYTEMLFNYLRQSLDFYKNETDLLNYVDFKSWIRNHKECWKNPLHEHSNVEVYGEDMWRLVEKWLS